MKDFRKLRKLSEISHVCPLQNICEYQEIHAIYSTKYNYQCGSQSHCALLGTEMPGPRSPNTLGREPVVKL